MGECWFSDDRGLGSRSFKGASWSWSLAKATRTVGVEGILMSLVVLVMLAGQVPAQMQPKVSGVPVTPAVARTTSRFEVRLVALNDVPRLPSVGDQVPPPPPPPAEESEASPSAPAPLVPAPQVISAPVCGPEYAADCAHGEGYGMVAGGVTPGCPGGCPSYLEEDDTKICKLGTSGDLYPHYAYFPVYHGYYYFRPYNYTAVAEHQRFASCIGLDPRMPYSLSGFQRIYANFPIQFTPARAPIGTALPQGSGLAELESLLVEP